VKFHHGDALLVLSAMCPDTVDALVTDPPAGISFMGKEWDSDKGGREAWIKWMTEVMQECLRVLKPGAHGLVWALPRTSHWTATALENAGFEVRDVVNHIFGTGFPKSLNIGKAIDKAAGAERPVIGKLALPASQNRVMTMGRPKHSGSGWQDSPDLTAPATPEAKQWDGWGTALKPAHEHWILVRKPLSEKTVAANVLKHGTGGINVDGCRVSHSEILARPPLSTNKHEGYQRPWNNDDESRTAMALRKSESADKAQAQGRFPANLILSEEAAADLDQHSGIGKSIVHRDNQRHDPVFGGRAGGRLRPENTHNDTGGASRFFYVAKASKADKGADNKHPTVKNTKLMQYLVTLITPPGGVVLDPFMGSGSTGVAAKSLGFDFIGVEQDSEYVEVARRRLNSDSEGDA
jgi:hypothetical protein